MAEGSGIVQECETAGTDPNGANLSRISERFRIRERAFDILDEP